MYYSIVIFKYKNITFPEFRFINFYNNARSANFLKIVKHVSPAISRQKLAQSMLHYPPKIDATFCGATRTKDNGVHIADFHKETCLINQKNRPTAKTIPFTLSTELFYMTQQALELGVKAVHSQMLQMSRTEQNERRTE